MGYVECTIRPGLRDSEVGVTVVDAESRVQRLRIERDFLVEDRDRFYLPIGVVARHPQDGRVHSSASETGWTPETGPGVKLET